MGLHRAALKVGTLLNGKRLVMDIANDVRLRLKDHLSALNGALHSTVYHHSLGSDGPGDMGFAGDNQRSAVQFAIYPPIDLH